MGSLNLTDKSFLNMPSDASKAGKSKSKPLVKSGPVYTPQTDTVYDMDLKRPITTMKDLGLLAFCAWNFVVFGAVLGQYVADMFLYYWFLALMVGINIALVVALGSPLLWGQYVKRDMRASMAKMAIAGGAMVGVMVLTWGVMILVLTYQDFTRLGLFSLPFPVFSATWQVALYWTGLILSAVMWAVVESVWWNLAYNNLCNGSWPLRGWGVLCAVACGWCLCDPMMKGEYWWLWMLYSGLMGGLVNFLSHIMYDMASLGGAVGLRLGFWFGNLLLWAHIQWQWWGLETLRHQWSWTPGNLLNLADQGTVPPPL